MGGKYARHGDQRISKCVEGTPTQESSEETLTQIDLWLQATASLRSVSLELVSTLSMLSDTLLGPEGPELWLYILLLEYCLRVLVGGKFTSTSLCSVTDIRSYTV